MPFPAGTAPGKKKNAASEKEERQREQDRQDDTADGEVAQDECLGWRGGIDVAGGVAARGITVEETLRIADAAPSRPSLVGEILAAVVAPLEAVLEDGVEFVPIALVINRRFDDRTGRRHPVARGQPAPRIAS